MLLGQLGKSSSKRNESKSSVTEPEGVLRLNACAFDGRLQLNELSD
jgi:hypothetical protein